MFVYCTRVPVGHFQELCRDVVLGSGFRDMRCVYFRAWCGMSARGLLSGVLWDN